MHQVSDLPVVLGRDNHCTDHCGSAAKIHQSANPPTASVSPVAITHVSNEIQYWPVRIASHRHQPQFAPRGVLAMDVASTACCAAPPFAGQPGSRVCTFMPQKGHQSWYITITLNCLHRQVVKFAWCPTNKILSKCSCACINFTEPEVCQSPALHCQTVVQSHRQQH